jgi:disulfide bond formation protein DsbB
MQSLQEIEAERGLLIIIVFLSLGSLFVAFLGQHVFDIRPCILCICQRIPY